MSGLAMVRDARARQDAGRHYAALVPEVIQEPDPDTRRRLRRDLPGTRLVVNALAVAEDYRRRGAGKALMRAAEE